jgi:hypothetical protein
MDEQDTERPGALRDDDRNEEIDESPVPDPEETEPRPEDDPQAD